MKRFATTVLFLIVLLAVSIVLRQTPPAVRNESLGLTSAAHTLSFTQQPGSIGADEGHRIIIATRRYKPRSTQPVRLTEPLIAGSITIVDPNESRTGGKWVARTIAASRTILHPLHAITIRTTVERTTFAHRPNTNVEVQTA